MKILLISLLSLCVQGCASSSSLSCNETRLVTPIAVAVQKHIAIITKQDVVIYPNCHIKKKE